jgi:hypothetical protein
VNANALASSFTRGELMALDREVTKADYDKTKDMMKGIARGIEFSLEKIYGRKLGFTLLVFEFNKPGISNYISNAERESMIIGLRESADRLENKEDYNNRQEILDDSESRTEDNTKEGKREDTGEK